MGAKTLISKVDSLSSKLSKLDTIERAIQDMSDDVKILKIRVDEVEKSQQFLDSKFEKQRNLGDLEGLHSALERAADDIVDLKCRSMRNNLLFFGIDEQDGPDFDTVDTSGGGRVRSPTEDCIAKIQTLARDTLLIPDSLAIDSAHRIGEKGRGKTRPIVARFNSRYRQQKEEVKQRSSKLRGTNKYITDQYPPEVQETRKRLWPICKKAREENKKAFIKRDKLYIDGVLHVEKTSDSRATMKKTHTDPARQGATGRGRR
ncbi:uncharacterized protein [Argopecten irradians]|uniref:uncharacterized protein n=1 Tax=Argopecten irradians TaxID=31199 RepID=UPI003713570F